MKYNKELFINNINYLIHYNYEPELIIKLNNGSEMYVNAYSDFVDLTSNLGEIVKLNKIEDIFNYFDFNDVVTIEGDIDYEFPIQVQSIVIDGKLWIDGISPKKVIKKYQTQFKLFMNIGVIIAFFTFIYFLITILNSNFFSTSVLIACCIYIGYIIIMICTMILLDIKRSKLVKKYYGIVSEEDRALAKKLLMDIYIVEKNEYDFFSLFHFDIDDLCIQKILKLLIKGKKIHNSLYEPIKTIEQELLVNSSIDKYNDLNFNNYIFELTRLIERNICII